MYNETESNSMECQPSYKLRTAGTIGNIANVLNFIQDEFIVSRQTAKRMIRAGTLLVYHLSQKEAVEHAERFKINGLLCNIVQMSE